MNKVQILKEHVVNGNFFLSRMFSSTINLLKSSNLNKAYKNKIIEERENFIKINNTGYKIVTHKNKSLFLNDNIFIYNLNQNTNENLSNGNEERKVLHFWNRSPGARYPKKANNGARPDCRSVRKIRKRLKTGK
ncbi:hypothetical protein PFAG_05168 [Plasmodium falciparum Santa Lucia]|uniref:Uncharacterized protein n=16 Tax=Plasmodium falciparum TaxID=5833 RepID=Q8ILZ0_PLAF7|nr:conserved Plasmodium protein, unknown function [Plasmodium falciparum 3D7]ETW16465.1 hypothetical protein PFFVO_04722 [Plasmodium falciparum Vietnam Oak-Knoll (FVO)]ETW29269.1 hypothetical protein PFFCH_03319 [Plasmodium falciparum FCH/4]ETW34216.1 hypothetical protein PFTANZ_05068 [Plasmodium falciparum Tanzania (2000708)]ETW40255.1 hypothetical protein PFNF135_05299 [Plasmodium falciparum NF135/5.C10]ETW46965.1 hypothetical protein PFMALIP_04955 [Plasmodium falciparum MaliPS096_E11]ETW53|eukprot:XP_001348276.1 conserved Plasmodium protein, unknown function [Plasmodium falciparum 3D7]